MPKLIDHDERDRLIADAAWSVLMRDGLAGFSVRNVASEANLATASLRRRFPTQDALRVYCLRLVAERVQHRLGEIDPDRIDGGPVAYAMACLEQLLPLDAERRAEMDVFLMLASCAPTDEAIRLAHADAHDSLARACRTLLELVVPPSLEPGLVTHSARRLHALLDGLALHLVRQPADADTTWALSILREELERSGG